MGFGNPQKLMKQVQKMQADMARLQEQLGDMTVEATAGGGAVRCVMTCKQEVKELTIDPELLDPQEVEMLQDMLIVAVKMRPPVLPRRRPPGRWPRSRGM